MSDPMLPHTRISVSSHLKVVPIVNPIASQRHLSRASLFLSEASSPRSKRQVTNRVQQPASNSEQKPLDEDSDDAEYQGSSCEADSDCSGNLQNVSPGAVSIGNKFMDSKSIFPEPNLKSFLASRAYKAIDTEGRESENQN